MPRDQIIKKAFEIADDGMQGAVGYFYYGVACQHIAKPQIVKDYLPRTVTTSGQAILPLMQMFHEWSRVYDPNELVSVMETVFVPYHIRTCILAIVSIFEAFLTTSIDRLISKGKISKLKSNNYKHRLGWAFPNILNSTYGNPAMQARKPMLCLDVDHARRVRNLWMHNNGNFQGRYKTDVLNVPGHKAIVDPEYKKFAKSSKSKVHFPITIEFFEQTSRSHIEALHHLHNMLQVSHFGQKKSYGYSAGQKKIEWSRVLIAS